MFSSRRTTRSANPAVEMLHGAVRALCRRHCPLLDIFEANFHSFWQLISNYIDETSHKFYGLRTQHRAGLARAKEANWAIVPRKYPGGTGVRITLCGTGLIGRCH